jgi:hypothetical protein
MANRFPLIVDSSNQNIKELPDGDSLLLGDSEKLLLGDGTDLSLYHDGSNSYLTNATGALKLATESSGIAITIGHTTSETTIGDNLVVTGDLSVGGVTLPETIADTVGAMVTSNTESGITVAYQDADNTLDFTIGTLNQNTTGSAATLTTARTIGGTSFDGSANIAVGLAATATALATARTIGGTSFDGTANIAVGLASTATALATSRTIHGVGFDGTANIDLSEVISDTVGAMFSSNTETGIVATYQDADNTIDLVIGDDVIVQSMIADDAIDSQHYVDGSIDLAHMSVNSIDSDQYVDGSIDLAHMSVNSIDSDQYVDGSIDTAHIGDDQITTDKLANAINEDIASKATTGKAIAMALVFG